MGDRIMDILKPNLNNLIQNVQHKNVQKSTTTQKFKEDLWNILFDTPFKGDAIEIGCGHGHTTVILADICFRRNKILHIVDKNEKMLQDTANVCARALPFEDLSFIKYHLIDVYQEKIADHGIDNIGCAFIDCLHTGEGVHSDIFNVLKVSVQNPMIFLHDFGLIPKGLSGASISEYITDSDIYSIVNYLGEKDNWNFLGSGDVIDWEGAQIEIDQEFYENFFINDRRVKA